MTWQAAPAYSMRILCALGVIPPPTSPPSQPQLIFSTTLSLSLLRIKRTATGFIMHALLPLRSREEELSKPSHQNIDLGYVGVEELGSDSGAKRSAGYLLPS